MAAATNPKQYSIELGQHRCREILRDLQSAKDKSTGQPLVQQDPDTGCILYLGKLTKDGHWQIQRRPRYNTRPSQRTGENQHKAYYVHRIAYLALHGTDVMHTASHLCGRGNCINAYHIHDEPIDLNVARINCLGFVECLEHHHRLATLCQHQPPCIKKPIAADKCCLSIYTQQGSAPQSESQSTQEASQTRYQDFLDPEQDLPQNDQWLESSAELFDIGMEIASPEASSFQVPSLGPIQPPSDVEAASPPPWKSVDTAGESQQTSTSFYAEEDPGPSGA